MDTSLSFAPKPLVAAGKPSRLPAGSTLLVNGIHVPHPHAEVNLPGAGDPRVGITDAVTETFETTETLVDGKPVVTGELKTKPLADEVRPTSLTTAKGAIPVDRKTASVSLGAAAPAKEKLAVDPVDKSDPTDHS